MIRKNLLFCKLIRIKSSSKVLFDSYMGRFNPGREVCPVCGSGGNCHIHAYYGRNIVDFIQGRPTRMELTITRLVCDSCGHTHAVLPDPIIPYSCFGLFFLLRVLAEVFASVHTQEQICERFGITRNQLRKWRALWNRHKQEWLGILDAAETPDRVFLRMLVHGIDEYAVFARDFTGRTALSFLQSHKNPVLLQKNCKL